MRVYEARPGGRVARKVWDRVSSYAASFGANIDALWYNPPGNGDFAGQWMFTAKRDDPSSMYSTMEGSIFSDLSGFERRMDFGQRVLVVTVIG